MRVILVNQRYGHTRTYVIRGWLKGLLSLCLLGAPVALGYLGYQLSVQSGDQWYAQQQASSAHAAPIPVGTASSESASFAPVDPSALSFERESTPCAHGLLPGWFDLPAVAIQFSGLQVVSLARRTFRHGRIIDPSAYLARIGH